jgi:hypothetical protein
MFKTALIGLGATLFIDLWSLLLKHAFTIRSLDYCLLGRWLLHMLEGKIVHENIGASPAKMHECAIGWTAHYAIGVTFALIFVVIGPENWLAHPTLLAPLAFGVATVAIPLFIMQPSFGLGVAASKTPSPNRARLKSLMTHAVFGLGLYAWAYLLS